MASRSKHTRPSARPRRRKALWKTPGSARRFRLHRAPVLVGVIASAGVALGSHLEALNGNYTTWFSIEGLGGAWPISYIPLLLGVGYLSALQEHDTDEVEKELAAAGQAWR